ncbi:MAG: HAMP domain-containing sensor histidine kinase [Christensenella sp.]|uniref:sensor histidine kinase n=1 Tax=Christensenella sp. TaxID=1935934 RepID=UPI002B209094|nr:HAMP domain-containing sensor histidine kinase [Christensenella sp.]MEA5002653.1 HAMP domain-containing sensor histidine kinase [Christensenella sp.]
MDTRSTKSRYKIWYKLIAWILCIASACGATIILSSMLKTDTSTVVTSGQYVDSREYLNQVEADLGQVQNAYFGYGDEVLKNELRDYLGQLKQGHEQEIREILETAGLGGYYEEYIQEYEVNAENVTEETDTSTSAEMGSADQSLPDFITRIEDAASEIAGSGSEKSDAAAERSGISGLPEYDQYVKKQLETVSGKYAELLANAEQYITQSVRQKGEQASAELMNQKEFYFAVLKNGELLYTNTVADEADVAVDFIQKLDANQKYNWEGKTPGIYLSDVWWSTPAYTQQNMDGVQIYLGMSNEAFARNQADYNALYLTYLRMFILVLVCVAVFSVGFLWLMYTAGRSPKGGEVKVSFMDSIYLDIGGIALVIIVALIAAGVDQIASWVGNAYGPLQVMQICSLVSVAVALCLMWSMSISRRVKRHESYTLVAAVSGGIKNAYDRSGMGSKGVGAIIWYLIGGLLLILFMVFLGFVINVFGVIIGLILLLIYVIASVKFILKKAAAIREISIGVEKIKDGDLTYPIRKGGGVDLDKIATGIEHIAEGLDAAVQHEVKSERMKTELITNVSHDIKTPLTSILTYIDLLKKEGLSSPNGPKYLDVLDMKSKRLKSLTDDLFEAAKATSGDMNVEMTRIELIQFMEQALGELSDKIDASGLMFVSEMPDEKMYVSADGRLLWRVIGNVLENALKYAADSSRVYITIKRVLHNVCIVVKNVSRDELNMTEEELMERFKRGDESRHTEGSGLGLSIARNFMQLMNGLFSIEIDGDLFKVIISFPEYREVQSDDGEAPEAE